MKNHGISCGGESSLFKAAADAQKSGTTPHIIVYVATTKTFILPNEGVLQSSFASQANQRFLQ